MKPYSKDGFGVTELNELPVKGNFGGYVYIVSIGDKTKIGKSINPFERVCAVLRNSGHKSGRYFVSPECVNYSTVERELHAVFSDKRINGEWFQVSFEDAVMELKKQNFETQPKARTKKAPEFDIQLYAMHELERMLIEEPVIADHMKKQGLKFYYDEIDKKVYVVDNDGGFMDACYYVEMERAFLSMHNQKPNPTLKNARWH